jgi:hypothetical protein
MPKPRIQTNPIEAPDDLVADAVVASEFSITAMSMWRWDRDKKLLDLGWPLPVRIRTRKFRSRRALETFKHNLQQQAIARRAARETA